MNPEKKYQIFTKYDLSKLVNIERAEIHPETSEAQLCHGIAGVVQGLTLCVELIAKERVREVQKYKETQDEIYKFYGWLQSKYQGIDWDELHTDDPDLAIFFRMKELIDGLGRDINSFLEKSLKNLQGRIRSKEYERIETKISEIGRLMQKYRQTKARLRTQTDLEAGSPGQRGI
ncbi:MAG: hypothetical protein PVJ69_01425 [Desulfobacteraceae bacterium]|jgi:hypothetical protein